MRSFWDGVTDVISPYIASGAQYIIIAYVYMRKLLTFVDKISG
jgi:hypothetical protein